MKKEILYFTTLVIGLWGVGAVWAEESLHDGTIRIVAGNLTSGNLQSYDQGHGSRILQALTPDIALLQEVRFGDNSFNQLKGWVDAVFGKAFTLYLEKTELPNAVVSRFAQIDSGSWDDPEQVNRDFAWARIVLPEGGKILAVSVHLSAKNEEKRERSARALLHWIAASLAQDELLLIGGDFNTQRRDEPALKILRKEVVIEPPYPSDEDGNENTNRNRNKPYDAIYVSKSLHEKEKPVNLVEGTAGLVFDSRVFRDLAKVPPVQSEDSDAPQMQHMAVVRDFSWP
jgi:endonuclease/exonuclease/phosphatase family metal-dependent hydrolase